MSVGFPVAVRDDTQEGQSTMVDDMFGEEDELADLVEVDTSEDMDLLTVEQERRKAWRISSQRLYKAFVSFPQQIDGQHVEAAQIHRCATCRKTSPKKSTHKTTISPEYKFNHTAGIDFCSKSVIAMVRSLA